MQTCGKLCGTAKANSVSSEKELGLYFWSTNAHDLRFESMVNVLFHLHEKEA